MDLLVPGMFYFRDIFEVGRANRYYLNAIEGLMTVQEKLHDSPWSQAFSITISTQRVLASWTPVVSRRLTS